MRVRRAQKVVPSPLTVFLKSGTALWAVASGCRSQCPHCVRTPMSTSVALPDGISQEALLASLRPLCWGAADILRAYARGEQPPHGFPKALSVDDGGEGPVYRSAVNQWLLDGLQSAFPSAGWTLEVGNSGIVTEGEPLAADCCGSSILSMAPSFLGAPVNTRYQPWCISNDPWWAWCCCRKWTGSVGVVGTGG